MGAIVGFDVGGGVLSPGRYVGLGVGGTVGSEVGDRVGLGVGLPGV